MVAGQVDLGYLSISDRQFDSELIRSLLLRALHYAIEFIHC